jgi:N-acetylmuramoyl-L-alanine amidase
MYRSVCTASAVLTIVASALAPYAAYGENTIATPYLTEDAPVGALSRAFGFEVHTDMRSTKVRVVSQGHEIVLAPGMSRALVDGRAMILTRAPRYADGVLVIPACLADVVRRLGDSQPAEAPGQERSKPARGTHPKAAFLPGPVEPTRLILAGEPSATTESAHKKSEAPRHDTPLGTIVIDPGHGGNDGGATGPTGAEEKTVVLDISIRLAAALRNAGYRVTLTRTADETVALGKRSDVANRMKADAFISIHANSFSDTGVKGVETWIASRRRAPSLAVNFQSRKLARGLQQAVVAATHTRDRGVREGRYMVLSTSAVPAALVEIGFLSNAATEAMLSGAESRERIAQAMAKAVALFCTEARAQR